MKRIRVPLGKRGYSIEVEDGLIDKAGERIARVAPGGKVFLITDRNVARRYAARVERSLRKSGFHVCRAVLPAGETQKSLATMTRLWNSLARHGIDRSDMIVALGGGVVGDAAGFAAAGWQRGIDLIQVPTTVVAQVDSSVGGKTGINLEAGKNLVGAFHQPRLVLIDPLTLRTLPRREFCSGLGEVVKYGMIRDPRFFAWLEKNAGFIMNGEPETMARIAARCCRLKSEYVAADERDMTGRRAHLNYGHTFGHAVETATGYGTYLHGEAVALGMVAASRLSVDRGWMTDEERRRLLDLLKRFKLPLTGVEQTWQALVSLVSRDKKREGGRARIVLTRGIGTASLVTPVGRPLLRRGFQEICSPRR